MLQMVFRALTGRNITHLSKTMTSRLNTRFLVTAVALDGIGGTLQPLFRLYSVIYELDGSDLTLSVLAAGLISVVMSWFPAFWPFSALTPEWSWSRYTWRCCGFGDLLLLFLILSLGSLCYPVSFVCAAGKLNRITSTPHLPRSRSKLETVFLDFELPHAASGSLLKPFILFGTGSLLGLSF